MHNNIIHNRKLHLNQLDISLSCLRIIRPDQQEKMCRSLRGFGQFTPVIVRKESGKYQVLDGFKRYYAAERLGWESLHAMILEVSITQGKAMILNYNKANQSMLDYDEALILYSLKKDHLMDQQSISRLTGYSRSWVCRRLALIEKLDTGVQHELRMGMISNSQARSIVRLPRGNQQAVMRAIITHHVTSRDSSILVEKYLQSTTNSEQQYVLDHPLEVIEQSTHKQEIYDTRLGQHGNRLLKSIELLLSQQNIFTGHLTHYHTDHLRDNEKSIISGKLERLKKSTTTILSIINNQ